MTARDDTTFEELLARRKDGAGDPTGAAGSSATAAQGAVRVALGGILWHAFGRPGQAGAGWWFVSGVDLQSSDSDQDRWRPDLAGFRRRRGESVPSGQPIRERPDWACQIVARPPSGSPAGDAARPRPDHRRRVPHLWIADTSERTLDIYRWTASGYEALSKLGAGATVRAAPFKEIAISIDEIFDGT